MLLVRERERELIGFEVKTRLDEKKSKEIRRKI